jgi:hypothetical protein
MSAVNMDVINGYLLAVEKINIAKDNFSDARDAQHAAVLLSNYMLDEFFIKKAELAQAKLNAKPALKAYKEYCAKKEIK